MSSIIHLKDLYDKNGYEFIEKLFSNDVYITEKIDASRFAFERGGDGMVYFKRDSGTPINLIDRTIMKFYEPAIEHIESLKLDSIPIGVRFGFEYFTSKVSGSIVYDKLPKNNLILTDIFNGGTFDTNVGVLIKYSKDLKVSPPSIIFNGKLSSEQKEKLVEFLTIDWDDLFIKFKTRSFTSYIISILNPKLKNTALNIGINKSVEGFVFSFNDGDSFINVKVVDPLFTQKAREIAKSKFTTEKKEKDIYTRELLNDILSFLKTKAILTIKYKSSNKDEKYVELLSNVFKQYYLKNKSKFKSISITSNGVNSLFDINYKYIPDSEFIKILKSNESVKMMFKTFMSIFGKLRKKSTTILSKSMVLDVNNLISKFKEL